MKYLDQRYSLVLLLLNDRRECSGLQVNNVQSSNMSSMTMTYFGHRNGKEKPSLSTVYCLQISGDFFLYLILRNERKTLNTLL